MTGVNKEAKHLLAGQWGSQKVDAVGVPLRRLFLGCRRLDRFTPNTTFHIPTPSQQKGYRRIPASSPRIRASRRRQLNPSSGHRKREKGSCPTDQGVETRYPRRQIRGEIDWDEPPDSSHREKILSQRDSFLREAEALDLVSFSTLFLSIYSTIAILLENFGNFVNT